MDVLIGEVLKFAGAALASALVVLVVKLLQRVGIALDADRREALERVALQGAARAEEWAEKQIKAKLKVPSAAKMNQAIAHVLERIPNVTAEEAEAVVTAALPQMGLGASAGAKALGKAIRSRS